MKILAKCGLVEEEVIDKIKKGSNSFEIYTESRNIDDIYKNYNKNLNLIKKLGMNVYIIHPPMDGNFEIEDLILNFKKIEDIFFLSNEIGRMQNRVIYVILHMGYSISILEKLNVKEEIFKKLKFLINNYRNTNVAIENVMAVNFKEREGGLYLRTNCKYESAEFAEEFNKSTNNNIGTVLDICHALTTIEILNNFKGIVEHRQIPTIDDYIDKFAGTLKIVHLAYYRNLGVGIGNHGTPYRSEEEVKVLEQIMTRLQKHNYSGIITIEVGEEDYLNTKNWVITRDNLYNVLDKLNINYCKELITCTA